MIRTVWPLKQASTDSVTEGGSTAGSSCAIHSGLPAQEPPDGIPDGDSWLSESSVGCTFDDTDTIAPSPCEPRIALLDNIMPSEPASQFLASIATLYDALQCLLMATIGGSGD